MATSIISIAISVAILWIAYRLLFINSNRLVFNRAFLIIALGFSLILPAAGLYIGKSTPQIVSYKQSLFQGIMLDEVVITAEGVTISTQSDVKAYNDGAAPVVASNKRSFDIIGLMVFVNSLWRAHKTVCSSMVACVHMLVVLLFSQTT